MFRILSLGTEIITASIVLIPVMLVLGKTLIHNAGRTVCYMIFALYLAAVYALTGLPSVFYVRLDLSFDFVPFLGMATNVENNILNVLLFVPLGMLLPVLAQKYRAMKQTVLFGFAVTVLVEFLQIFTYRVTDINDIITNACGTMIGYFITKWLLAACPQLARIASGSSGKSNRELYVVCGIVFVVMFFVQPIISALFWEMGLAGV